MSRTVQDLAFRLTAEIPQLGIEAAGRLIQDALRDIYDAHSWSFLESEGILYSPAMISSGTFSVTFGSNQIQADATAKSALSSLTNPVITKRQLRLSSGWPSYNIFAYDEVTGIITLDRIYRDTDSASGVSYVCYRIFYGYPEGPDGNEVTDFKAYKSIVNPSTGYAFSDLSASREALDIYDPQRMTYDNPQWLVSYKSSSGIPQWEMYPHSTASQVFPCIYQARWTDQATSNELPPALNESLVIERAKFYGFRWAEAHKGVYPELKGVAWMALAAGIDNGAVDNPQGSYYRALEIAKNKDREMFLDMIVTPNSLTDANPIGDAAKTGYSSISYTTE